MICQICNWEIKYFLSWKDYRYNSSSKIYDIYKCNKCKTEQIYPIPTKEEQKLFYSKNYYSFSKNEQSWKLNNKIKNFIDSLRFIFFGINFKITKWGFDNFVDENIKKDNYYILDIWCGDRNTKNSFWSKWTRNWFEIWEKRKDTDIYYWQAITDINFQNKYDALMSIHSLEHIDKPNEFIKKSYDILNDWWFMLMKLPSCEWVFTNIIWKYSSERDIPRHIFNYSQKWLEILCEKWWFKIIKSLYLKNYCTYNSLQRYIKSNFSKDITKSKFSILFSLLFYIIDMWISFLPLRTNQLWIIIQKQTKLM